MKVLTFYLGYKKLKKKSDTFGLNMYPWPSLKDICIHPNLRNHPFPSFHKFKKHRLGNRVKEPYTFFFLKYDKWQWVFAQDVFIFLHFLKHAARWGGGGASTKEYVSTSCRNDDNMYNLIFWTISRTNNLLSLLLQTSSMFH